MCNRQAVEDKIYFITCTKYDRERNTLLEKVCDSVNIDHLTAKDLYYFGFSQMRTNCKHLAKYTHECLDIRKMSLADQQLDYRLLLHF